MVDVSIVLITWNIRDLLQNCLSSIYSYTNGVTFEIILVDNNSTDGSKEMVREKFPDIRLIENPVNRGVARARNQGIKFAQGRYILILDTDTRLSENSILRLYEFMEVNPTAGLVGSKLVDAEGKYQLTSRRFPVFSDFFLRRIQSYNSSKYFSSLQRHIMSDWDHNEIMDVDYVIGACQFIRTETLRIVGLYDEKIFYGPEDLDYCLRVWRKGFRVVYYPFTSVFHLEQRITKKNPFSILALKHLIGVIYLYIKYRGKLSRTMSV